MLTGLFRMMAWFTVEAASLTYDFALNGRGMSFFPYVKQIES
ncbi:hypothetical protein [Pseudalkalibacillus decolorationis]|nr:hypothetical protein [Pseudalkalibacillus decolorationis]